MGIEGFTLTGMLKKAATDFPSRRAIAVPTKFDLTHARLQALVDSAATRLTAAGILPSDVVALTFPNTVEVLFLSLSVSLSESLIRTEDFLAACDHVSGCDPSASGCGTSQRGVHARGVRVLPLRFRIEAPDHEFRGQRGGAGSGQNPRDSARYRLPLEPQRAGRDLSRRRHLWRRFRVPQRPIRRGALLAHIGNDEPS